MPFDATRSDALHDDNLNACIVAAKRRLCRKGTGRRITRKLCSRALHEAIIALSTTLAWARHDVLVRTLEVPGGEWSEEDMQTQF